MTRAAGDHKDSALQRKFFSISVTFSSIFLPLPDVIGSDVVEPVTKTGSDVMVEAMMVGVVEPVTTADVTGAVVNRKWGVVDPVT